MRTYNKFVKIFLIFFCIVLAALLSITAFVYLTNPEHILEGCDWAYVIAGDNKTEASSEDTEEMKEILGSAKMSITDSVLGGPSCDFYKSHAVEFSGGDDKSVVVCPAYDGDGVIKINSFFYELSEEDNEDFYSIAEKYGLYAFSEEY